MCCAAAIASWLAGATAVADSANHESGRSEYRAPKARRAPIVDGIADEPVWWRAPWREIKHRWLGPEYSPEDFQGRFKVAWTPERIYILVELVDDVLFDSHRDPLIQYWDDDCLEIFVDDVRLYVLCTSRRAPVRRACRSVDRDLCRIAHADAALGRATEPEWGISLCMVTTIRE